MTVRRTSALRADIHRSFSVDNRGAALERLANLAAVSSPKAKVTRSNRVGCASVTPDNSTA
jgi:hypothetical protein